MLPPFAQDCPCLVNRTAIPITTNRAQLDSPGSIHEPFQLECIRERETGFGVRRPLGIRSWGTLRL